MHEICISSAEKEDSELWQNRAFSLMKVICFVFYKTTKDLKDYKYLYSLLSRNTLLNILEKNFQEFEKYPVISNFVEIELISYTKPTAANPNPVQNSTMKEQYGYMTMQYSMKFGTLIEELEIFKNIEKEKIIEELKNPKPVLSYSIFIDKDRDFLEYMKELSGKEVSFYNKEFKKKNNELLDTLKKVNI